MYAQRKAVVLGADGGIPGFWGTVIEHHHLMQEEITEKDQGVLRHLQELYFLAQDLADLLIKVTLKQWSLLPVLQYH